MAPLKEDAVRQSEIISQNSILRFKITHIAVLRTIKFGDVNYEGSQGREDYGYFNHIVCELESPKG